MKKKQPQRPQPQNSETPEPESLASFSIRLPRELLTQVQQYASQHDRSMNGEIVWALRAYVQNSRKAAVTVSTTGSLKNFRGEGLDVWAATNPVVAYATLSPDSAWVCLACAASGTVGATLTPVHLEETNLEDIIHYNLGEQATCSICGQEAFVDNRRANESDESARR